MSNSPKSPSERRVHARIETELRCYSSNRRKRWLLAQTLNLSRSGALLLWSDDRRNPAPTVGGEVKVDLELPHSRGTRRCLRCRGSVVWVREQDSGRMLVALAIGHMSFVTRDLPTEVARRAAGRAARPAKAKVMAAGGGGDVG